MSNPKAHAPRVRIASRKIPMTVRAEAAREVVITGDFTGWAKDGVKLTPVGNGEWQATLVLPPGEYQYRLRIDGEWRDDEKAVRRVANPFGTENDVLIVK